MWDFNRHKTKAKTLKHSKLATSSCCSKSEITTAWYSSCSHSMHKWWINLLSIFGQIKELSQLMSSMKRLILSTRGEEDNLFVIIPLITSSSSSSSHRHWTCDERSILSPKNLRTLNNDAMAWMCEAIKFFDLFLQQLSPSPSFSSNFSLTILSLAMTRPHCRERNEITLDIEKFLGGMCVLTSQKLKTWLFTTKSSFIKALFNRINISIYIYKVIFLLLKQQQYHEEWFYTKMMFLFCG